MAFDPEAAREYPEVVEYPANKEDLARAGEANGAPDDLIGQLQTMGRPEAGPEEVVAELRAAPGAG